MGAKRNPAVEKKLVGLADLVEGHDHHGRAVIQHLAGVHEERLLAFLQVLLVGVHAEVVREGVVVAGNLLSSPTVLSAAADAFDADLLRAHLRELLEGNPIEQPIYDYTQHRRTNDSRRISDHLVVVLEGILILILVVVIAGILLLGAWLFFIRSTFSSMGTVGDAYDNAMDESELAAWGDRVARGLGGARRRHRRWRRADCLGTGWSCQRNQPCFAAGAGGDQFVRDAGGRPGRAARATAVPPVGRYPSRCHYRAPACRRAAGSGRPAAA